DHEGLRARRCEPPDNLQLARIRESRIRADRGRFGADIRRHALARPASLGPSRDRGRVAAGTAQSGLSTGVLRTGLANLRVSDPPDFGMLFHRLNNQLGIILAHAELL